jgi:hypothetical protein
MHPDESPEAKYDRVKRKLQDSILSQYPNPERKGCPGSAVLQSLATRYSDESVEGDENWRHVTHCSECYREFLDFRLNYKGHAKRRSLLIAWGVAAAILALAVGLFFAKRERNAAGPERPQNAEVAYHKRTIDIPSMTRSENARGSSSIALNREPEELTVNLPVGSKAGTYEFGLLKGDRAIVSAHADAEIHNGTTAFIVKIDLSKVASGEYSMNVRRVPWDWSHFPVVVR